MDITRVEGKFKLGQNRSLDDQRATLNIFMDPMQLGELAAGILGRRDRWSQVTQVARETHEAKLVASVSEKPLSATER